MTTLWDMVSAFCDGFEQSESQCTRDREMREQLSEYQIDTMISESFPASDPPSVY